MVFFRRISGSSMSPTLRNGDVIVGWRSEARLGDIVLALHDGREIVKRVTSITSGQYFLKGDNKSASTDSREFGMVSESAILGVMKLHFATATSAPKPRNSRAVYVGWIAALVMIMFAVVHLFRIDTFVPELDGSLPGGRNTAAWIAALLVVMEVFAVPFLLRMKLSPLARIKSAAFVMLAPLFWLLISVWSYNKPYSTAQLGEFQSLPSTWLLVAANVIWLGINFYALYLLQPSWSKELRKK